MWNNSEAGGFGESGGFDAGGFDSPGKGKAEKSGNRTGPGKAQNIVPVSCASLLELIPQQEAVRIGSHDIQQITIVGLVKSCVHDNISNTYEIDDTTGVIKVRQWTENEVDAETLMENSYVRVIGIMRTFQGEGMVMAHAVRPVTDMHEVSCHLMEVKLAKLYFLKDVYNKRLAMANSMQNHGGADDFKPSFNSTMSDGKPSFNYTGQEGKPSFNSGGATGPKGLQDQVYAILKTSKSESGMNIQEIIRRSGAPMAKIRATMDNLCSEGLAYTTLDDDHFATTDQMY